MARPALTLLLITHDGVARADFAARGGEPTAVWSQTAAATDDPWILDPILDFAPPAKRVWVLSDSAWTQTVELAAGAVAGLARPDLERALAFEAEPLSGIPAAQARLTAVPLGAAGGRQTFWVCEVTQDALDRCAATVRRYGSQLVGILHPAGVGVPLMVPKTAPWQRVELWPDTVVCTYGAPGQTAQVMVINTDPRTDRWSGPVQDWAQSRPAPLTETRLLDGSIVVSAGDATADEVEDGPEALSRLVVAWAGHIRGGAGRVPVVRPAARSLAPLVRGAFTVLLFVAAAAVCAADYALVSRDIPQLAAESAGLQEQTRQLQSLKAQRQKLETERTELAKQVDPLVTKVKHSEEALVAHRKRLAELVRVLGETCPKDLAVRKLEVESAEPRVRGLCLSPQSANAFATALDDRLRALSWRVLPPKLEAQNKLDGGGPWAFEIRFEDLARPGAPRPTPPASGD